MTIGRLQVKGLWIMESDIKPLMSCSSTSQKSFKLSFGCFWQWSSQARKRNFGFHLQFWYFWRHSDYSNYFSVFREEWISVVTAVKSVTVDEFKSTLIRPWFHDLLQIFACTWPNLRVLFSCFCFVAPSVAQVYQNWDLELIYCTNVFFFWGGGNNKKPSPWTGGHNCEWIIRK